MSVAGIDIGTRNLALCIIDAQGDVLLWELIDMLQNCPKKNKTDFLCKTMIQNLDLIEWENLNVESVLIENQYKGQFQNISNWMYCYFQIRGISVKFCDAKLKFNNIFAIPLIRDGIYDLKNYNDRKKLAIRATEAYLEERKNLDPKHKNFYLSLKKRDDISDALQYCLIQLTAYKAKI